MKAFLMFKDRDFDLKRSLPLNEQAMTQDLELNTLFNAMALGDEFLFDVIRRSVLFSLNDIDVIRFRQNILKDCLKNSATVKEIYNISTEAINAKKKDYWGFFGRYPSSILSSSIDVLKMYAGLLMQLKNIADEKAGQFESEGFGRFFKMIEKELNDEYLIRIQNYIKELQFPHGVLISAHLGKGNKGIKYRLHWLKYEKQSWIKRIFFKKSRAHTLIISDRDSSGAVALGELRDRGINLVANALAQSNDHILSFFNMLHAELAFYIGCLNLHRKLDELGEPMSFPLPVTRTESRHSFKGLYDVCLALTVQKKIVGNDVNDDYKNIVIITGANQGGKSTFLRSIGLSQLMMQCGMFVPARSFCSNVYDGIFTHFKREEDAAMNSGKLDEELDRMSNIIDHINSNSMLLFNESFAATNEREGSEIARQIVTALLEKRIKVFFVTHLYEFAYGFYDQKKDDALFLRAERKSDGARTFKLFEGKPLQTSYGEDLYKTIFEKEDSIRCNQKIISS